MWFNYTAGTYDWGVAQANDANADPPFSTGGTAIGKNPNGSVTINGAGNDSTMDIYLFDVTGDGNARDLQWILVDYEKGSGAASNQGRDPIRDAAGLRDGMNGTSFMGAENGGAAGTQNGVGQENTIFSAPSNTVSQRRWSLDGAFEQVTPGKYFFKAAFVMTPTNGGQAFQIDPEMDINN
jgi:hypothetical protein